MGSTIKGKRMVRGIGIFLLIVGLLLIASATTKSFNAEISSSQDEWRTPATGELGGDFTLTGHTNSKVSLHDFKGKLVLLFFGYTHCPVVCPTTMSTLNDALQELGDLSKDVQVLFVTVDPDRDTSEVLSEYVPYFNASFIGLTGAKEEIEAVINRYGVAYILGKPDEDGYYDVGHTSTIFLIDRQGRLKELFAYNIPSAEIAKTLWNILR